MVIVLLSLAAWTLVVVAALALARASGHADSREEQQLRELERSGARSPGEIEVIELAPEGYGAVLLKRLAVQACRTVGVDGAVILVSDVQGGPHVFAAGHRVNEAAIGKQVGPIDAATEAPRAVAVRELPPEVARLISPASRALIARAVGRTRAAVLIGGGDDRFNERDLALAGQVAELIAASLDDAGLGGRLDAALEGGVRALEAAIDGADLRSARPTRAIVGVATDLGRRLGLDTPALVELQLAARLRGAGDLVDGEWALPDAGAAELLSRVPGLEVVALIVRHSAERWDGRGQPDGLQADRIPLASRLLAVADEFCRLTAAEGPALTPAEAAYVLAGGARRAYDPTVVDALAARFAPDLAGVDTRSAGPSALWAAGDTGAVAA